LNLVRLDVDASHDGALLWVAWFGSGVTAWRRRGFLESTKERRCQYQADAERQREVPGESGAPGTRASPALFQGLETFRAREPVVSHYPWVMKRMTEVKPVGQRFVHGLSGMNGSVGSNLLRVPQRI